MIVNVLIPLALNEPFSYDSIFELKVGDVVVVPFGNKDFKGLVVDVDVKVSDGIKLKSVKEKINFSFNQKTIEFIRWISDYYLIPLGNVLNMLISPLNFLKDKKIKKYKLNESFNCEKITEKQQKVMDFLKNKIAIKEEIIENCGVGDVVIKNLVEKNIIVEFFENKEFTQKINDFNLNKLSEEQQKAYNFIIQNNQSNIENTDLDKNVSYGTFDNLDNLESKNDVKNHHFQEGTNLNCFEVNIQNKNIPSQKKWIKFQPFLLEGTTGSGKTEVYFHLIAKILKETDKQVLILLPEIALTTQLILRFQEQFNFEPAVWHSEISQAKKSEIFKNVSCGTIRLIIGTRSSLFLPFQNLGLIVVDEEHDQSYKQSDNGCYNGRDVAIMLAKLYDIPVILASATPSLETLINVDKGKYQKVFLPSRYGKAVLPDVKIIDLKKEKLKSDKYISKTLSNAIYENLQNHKQSMIFMNRRGYSPVLLCGDCGEKIKCPNCNTNLSYHKSKNRLICHHCEYFIERPQNCSVCGSENLVEFGPGVEKIEKEIKELFPQARTIIMASDTTDTNNKLQEVVEKILNNQVDIIIGTQLIAKGHHFPSLTLVGIVDSDASLFGGDIRATERTYQLLTQVSGRAGRAETKGVVYFQSYNTDNLILQAIKNNDKETLINFEKQNRELGKFPPYGKMATISISSLNETIAYRVAKKIVKKFPFNDDIEVYGVSPAYIPKMAKMYKFNIVVKTSKNINIQKLLKKCVLSEKYNSNVRIKIEIE